MKAHLVLVAVGSLGLSAACFGQVKINEVDSDTPGTDALEFIELTDGGIGNTPLDGLVVVLYNGSNDASYLAIDLDGHTTDANGYFLIGNASLVPAPDIVIPDNTLQNGPDAVALYIGDAADFPNGTPVTATNLVDAIVYGTADPDDVGLIAVLGGPQADESGRGNASTDSVGRICPDGPFVTLSPATPAADNGSCTEDTDGDGIPDNLDNCPLLPNPDQLDCNDNGMGDACEIASDPKLDCNGNGQLDACEPDCNETRYPDDCDVIFGISLDCNGNLIPDECENDCNLNGVPDDCDIANGTSLDVNGDGLPDDCDPDLDGIPTDDDNCPNNANPGQEDCDGDGIGDACETDPDKNGNGIPDNCELPPAPVRINEIRIDQTSVDNDEYFELKGPAGYSLDGLTLIVIGDGTGGSGVVESITSLNGHTIPADGHFLVAESTFTLAPGQVDLSAGATGLNFENGDNVTFVLVSGFTGSNQQDLDTNDDGVLDVTPWDSVLDAVALILESNPPTSTEWSYGTVLGGATVGPDGSFVPGQVYRCEPDGQWQIGLFNPDAKGAADTPGTANLPCEPGTACPADRNGDDVVNVADLLIVINTWGTSDPAGDADGNGTVNVADLLIIINGWGACPE